MHVSLEARRGYRIPGARVTSGCKPSSVGANQHWCWELNCSHWKGTQPLSHLCNPASFLRPPHHVCCIYSVMQKHLPLK